MATFCMGMLSACITLLLPGRVASMTLWLLVFGWTGIGVIWLKGPFLGEGRGGGLFLLLLG